MKTNFIFILFLPLYLMATNSDKTYEDAINAYKIKDYKTSYKLFSKIYLLNLSDAKLNFNFAHSAYELGEYETALAAYERVEILEPTNFQNKFEKAKTYFILKMYVDSELLLNDVLSNPLTSVDVRNSSKKYLSIINSDKDKSSTSTKVSLDYLYDSNINNGSLDDSYMIGSTSFPTTPTISDSAIQASAQVTNIYDLGDTDGFFVKNYLSVYSKDYHSYNDYDIKYLTYMPSLVYNYNKYSFDFALGVNLMTFGHKEYLKAFFIKPKLDYEHSYTLKSIGYFKYKNKSVIGDLDSNHYELSYALQNIISPSSYIQTKLLGIKQKKEGGSRIDIDFNDYKLNVVYGKQFTPTYSTQLSAEIGKREYSDFSTLFNSKRDDTSKSISGNLNINLIEDLLFKVQLKYKRVDSNQSIFTYQKYTAFAGIEKTF